jgi:hypothetical protein
MLRHARFTICNVEKAKQMLVPGHMSCASAKHRQYGRVTPVATDDTSKHNVSLNQSYCCGQRCLRNSIDVGRAIAQAVSLWLPTAAARVQARGLVRRNFCGGRSGAGAGFFFFLLRVLQFPPANLHSTNLSTITYHLGLVQ